MSKYIFITGGVLSALGKGIAAAAIGSILEARGLKVALQKLDPYINIDPGTMNPFEHGEVFVTDDGCETDLDLGHYERFTNFRATSANNYTSGKVYFNVITKERRGDYLGNTVQVVPHITDEIKRIIKSAADGYDILIVEIGGTVGDIESLPFLEAVRQFRYDVCKDSVLYIHLTLVPFIKTAGELKTKPTQHSVNELRGIGIQPDVLLCRTNSPLPDKMKEKIALHCNIGPEAVISALDMETVYEVPLSFKQEGLDILLEKKLSLPSKKTDLSVWQDVVNKIKNPKIQTTIAIVGKYIGLRDAYKSLHEALIHGGIANNAKVNLLWVNSEDIEQTNVESILQQIDGILIPGGFGIRGIQGKIEAIRFARTKQIPFFGICLGMQCAVIEIARNVCGLDANSSEFDTNTPNPVIYLMEEWFNHQTCKLEQRTKESEKGGTMRLGTYPCDIEKNTNAFNAYKINKISERHRHRYEFNNKYRQILSENNVVFSGLSPDEELVEIIEIKDHTWFLGCQFHPEFKSRPFEPHPLFTAFVRASIKNK